MTIGSKEHYDILAMFDKTYSHYNIKKESDKELWKKGYIYQSGETNDLYVAYMFGYAHGKKIGGDL